MDWLYHLNLTAHSHKNQVVLLGSSQLVTAAHTANLDWAYLGQGKDINKRLKLNKVKNHNTTKTTEAMLITKDPTHKTLKKIYSQNRVYVLDLMSKG